MPRPRGSLNQKTIERIAAEKFAQEQAVLQGKLARASLFTEIGSSGLTRFGGNVQEEFLLELKDNQKRTKVYREMRDNHPVIAATLFAIENALRQVKYYFESPTDNPADTEICDFLDECLNDMSFTWQDTLSQIMTMLQYGFSLFELVYKMRRGRNADPQSEYDDGLIGWRKWLSISQDTLSQGDEWKFDETGGIQGVKQTPPPDYIQREIPIEKMLHFRTTIAKNNPEGRSLLRSMYLPWFYSKNLGEIEGISAERMGCGLPIVYMGTDTMKTGTDSDLELFKRFVRDVRSDEQGGLVIPFPKMGMAAEGKGVLFELISPPSRGMIDFSEAINRYDKRIALSALAQFIMLGMEQVGSYALSQNQTDIFVMAMAAWAESITAVINRYAVPRLMELNPSFAWTELPQLQHSEIAVPDLAAIATYVNQLVGSGVITPDANLERELRERAHLPEKMETIVLPGTLPQGDLGAQADEIQGLLQGGLAGQADAIKRQLTGGGLAGQADTVRGLLTGGAGGLAGQADKVKQLVDNASAESFQIRTRRAIGGARYETATNAYQGDLEAMYQDWYATTARKLEKANDNTERDAILAAALLVLIADMQRLGRERIMEAALLGSGGEPLTAGGLSRIADKIAENDAYIETSLIPAIRQDASRSINDESVLMGGAVAIAGLFAPFLGRVASYAGSYWTSIFEGVGDALQQADDWAERRVEIRLDSEAQHCSDCPRLAKVYDNWQEMLAESGLPGSIGRSRCNSNCRCFPLVETSPGSGAFERFSAKENAISPT